MLMSLGTIQKINLISFLDLLAIGLLFPLFSNHLLDLGASHTVIGLLQSTYSGTQVISGPIIGGWSDVKGRQSVLKRTILICAISYGLLGLTESILVIFILRLFLGIFKHIQTICKSLVSDLVPPDKQTEIFGKTAALGSLGFMIGPIIGGHLSEYKNGFSIVCFISVLLFLFNLVFVEQLPIIPSTKKSHENRLSSNKEDNNTVLQNIKNEFSTTLSNIKEIDWTVHWDSFLLRFLFAFAMSIYFGSQSLLYREKYELTHKHIAYIMSFFSAFGSLTAYFLHIINAYYSEDMYGYQRLLHFYSLMAISLFGVYVSPNLYVLLVLMVPFSLACSVLRVVSMELMLKKSSKSHTGSFSGASNSIMSVARFISPLISGFLADWFGQSSVILFALIPVVIGAVICIRLRHSVI